MSAHTSIKRFEETSHPSLLEEILYGEGSLTLKLDKIFGKVVVERCRTSFVPLDEEAATTLDADAGERTMEREALLKAGSTALVYAKTMIPASTVSRALAEELMEGTTPLGRVLHSKGITLHRAGLVVTTEKNKEAAKELGLGRNATLYKRSYRLEGRSPTGDRSGGTVEILAAITEFISPKAARSRTVMKGGEGKLGGQLEGQLDGKLEGPLAGVVAARTG